MTFYEKFEPAKYSIKDFTNWIIVLRQKQITLGSAIIILKREVPSIGDATFEEMGELPEVIKWYEDKIRILYNAEKFNYFAAMMKDNFVHFHAIPRYSIEIIKFNQTWQDAFWPKPVSLVDVSTESNVLNQIHNELHE